MPRPVSPNGSTGPKDSVIHFVDVWLRKEVRPRWGFLVSHLRGDLQGSSGFPPLRKGDPRKEWQSEEGPAWQTALHSKCKNQAELKGREPFTTKASAYIPVAGHTKVATNRAGEQVHAQGDLTAEQAPKLKTAEPGFVPCQENGAASEDLISNWIK